MRRALGSFGIALSLALGAAQAVADDEVEYLVPEMEGRSFAIEDGKREYERRLAFTPAYGQLGADDYYSLRLAFNPNAWLGYEAHLGHNPSESVHALVHSLHAILRYPFSWRLQPYASAGYGLMLIFPGAVFKADPVTRNVLSVGGGLEIFVRNDVALRVEARGMTLMGGAPTTSGESYDYAEYSVGLSFYRLLGH